MSREDLNERLRERHKPKKEKKRVVIPTYDTKGRTITPETHEDISDYTSVYCRVPVSSAVLHAKSRNGKRQYDIRESGQKRSENGNSCAAG